jgi:hypothetical protein
MTHDDDKFEAFLEREARAYNAPPAEVPREAMWQTIASARATHRAAPAAAVSEPVKLGAAVGAVRPRRPMRYAPWMGMAATLLIGVGIGRFMLRDRTTALATPDSTVAATPISDSGASVTAPAPSATPVDAAPVPRAPRGEAVRYAAAGQAARESRSAVVTVAQPAAPSRRNTASPTYAVASQQHLTRAEALVAVVATMPQDAMMDSLTARWAKDVLTNTRLLLDSPAGDDPVRRRLLEDLETVLVQLVQRSGRDAEDRAMIDRTLQKTQLLTRLRSGATGT